MIFSRGVARNERHELRRPAQPSRRSAPSVGEPLDMSWGQLAAVMSGNMGQYSGLITHERAYRESPWVGPMLHASASACAARPFRLYRENAKGKARLAEHWLLDLMGRPNPEAGISEYTLKYRTFFLYDYDGEVLWHLGRNDRTSPTEPPDFITIFRRREAVPVLDHALGEFIGWHLTIDGVPYFADRNDVIHFHHFDPITHRSSFNPFTKRRLEPNRGRSPLDAKRLAISSDIAAARYNYDFFSRGIASNVAIIDKASTIPLGEEQEFKEKLRAQMAGQPNDPFIFSGDWTVQALGAAQKDAEFSQGRKFAKEEQLAGLTVPILMAESDATYANAQAQRETLWEVIQIPKLMYLCSTIDAHLLRDEPDVWSELGTDDVDALQVQKSARFKSAIELRGAGMPMDVAARSVGLEIETYEGSDVAFGHYTDIPIGDIIEGASKAEVTTELPATAQKPPDLADAPPSSSTPPADDLRFFRVIKSGMAERSFRIIGTRMAGPFDYGSTQINFSGDVRDALLALAASVPDEALAENGRETDAHVTVRYGIKPDVTAEDVHAALAASEVAGQIAQNGGMVTFGRTAFFAKDEYDVVYVEIDSSDLVALNEVIGVGVESIESEDAYVPHATVAYVRAGRGADFAGNESMLGMVARFDGIEFSDTDGNLTPVSLTTLASNEWREVARIIHQDDARLQAIARRFHVRMLLEGSAQIAELLGGVPLLMRENSEVAEFLAARADLVREINETSASQVLDALAHSSSTVAADTIRRVYNERKRDGEKLIARQECLSALNAGRFLEMQKRRVQGIEWLSGRGKYPCEKHPPGKLHDASIAALGEAFPNGCRYPQDVLAPGDAVLRCTCLGFPARTLRDRMLRTEKQRESYWNTAAVLALRKTQEQFAGALSNLFLDQRGRVLAKVAEFRSGKKKLLKLRRPALIEKRLDELTTEIGAFFHSQAPKITSAAVAGKRSRAMRADPKEPNHAAIEIDWSGLKPIIGAHVESIYEESANEITKELTGSPPEKANEAAAAYAEQRGGELIKGLERTTLDDIRAAEARAFRDGLTPDQLATEIDSIIDDPARAANIAKTELAEAQMTAARESAEASGLVSGKQSLLSNDHEIEDECDEAADAGVIPLEEPFPNGKMNPPFHPGGCECDMAMVLA